MGWPRKPLGTARMTLAASSSIAALGPSSKPPSPVTHLPLRLAPGSPKNAWEPSSLHINVKLWQAGGSGSGVKGHEFVAKFSKFLENWEVPAIVNMLPSNRLECSSHSFHCLLQSLHSLMLSTRPKASFISIIWAALRFSSFLLQEEVQDHSKLLLSADSCRHHENQLLTSALHHVCLSANQHPGKKHMGTTLLAENALNSH